MSAPVDTVVISAGSHMAEPPDLWEKNLPCMWPGTGPLGSGG